MEHVRDMAGGSELTQSREATPLNDRMPARDTQDIIAGNTQRQIEAKKRRAENRAARDLL